MITKSIVKDYIHRKCPYLAKAALDDNTLLRLIENYLEFGSKADLEDAISDTDGGDDTENPSEDNTFDILEIMQEYPHLRQEIEKLIIVHAQENPLYGLLKKYEDTQVTSRLSRRYIELIYGKENCKRCDVNDFGVESLNQKFIVQRTKQFLKDPNVKVLFEGQIEHLDLRARFDILIKEDNGTFTLIEAKGSNSAFKSGKDKSIHTDIKTPYLYDLLFQYYIYVKEGLNISRLGYLHLNRDFKYSKGNESYPNLCDEDVKSLFNIAYEMNYKVGKEETTPLRIIEYFDSDMYLKPDKDGNPTNPPIEEVISEIRDTGVKFEVNPKKQYWCVKGGKCPFLLSCFEDAENPNSVLKLTRWGTFGGSWQRSKKLIEAGIDNISDIPTETVNEYKEESEKNGVVKYGNARSQIKFQTEWKDKGFEYVIHMDLLNSILHRDYLNDDIDYLVFFDFESIQNPVPLMKDAHPWQQVVTQYSMHIVGRNYDLSKHNFAKGRGGNCSHYEFIGHPRNDGYTNPEFELFRTLKAQLIDFGIDPMAKNYKVVVFNQNFEKTRMNEFVRLYVSHPELTPELRDFVQNFNDNVVDLLDFFTSGSFYGSKFNGRGSLKVVQPTLCEDEDVNRYYESIGLPFDFKHSLDYHKEGALVYNGGICLDLYKALLVRAHIDSSDNDPDEQKMLDQALAYCKIDSWGTVIIYDVIKHVSDGNIKLKALVL